MSVSRETAGWRTWNEAEILRIGAGDLGVDLDGPQIHDLLRYWAELRKWNLKIKLIGPAEPPQEIVLHLLDSLSPLKFLPEARLRVIDMGSGAGLPGLVLKILRPGWEVTLSEARQKKAAFLRHAARTLGLSGLKVQTERLERVLTKDERPEFDLITARAFGPLSEVLPLARSILISGGRLLAYQGPRADKEIAKTEDLASTQGLELVKREHFRLPFLNHRRVLLFFQAD